MSPIVVTQGNLVDVSLLVTMLLFAGAWASGFVFAKMTYHDDEKHRWEGISAFLGIAGIIAAFVCLLILAGNTHAK